MDEPFQIYYTAHERATIVSWRLAEGAALSTREIAEMVGVTRQAAHYMMDSISRVAPVYRGDDSRWRRFNHTT